MSYLVVCTFALRNASRQDYETAYADLAAIGLKRVMVGDNGASVVIPTTTVAGTFNGRSARIVRDHICHEVQSAFRSRGSRSEIFVTVGRGWTWGALTT